METSTVFITRAFDLTYSDDKEKAISSNLWRELPKDISSFIGGLTVLPVSLSVNVRECYKNEISLHRSRHPDWHVFDDFVSVEFQFDWPEPAVEAQRLRSSAAGLARSELEEAV